MGVRRRGARLLALLALLVPAAARRRADVADYLGRPVASVAVEVRRARASPIRALLGARSRRRSGQPLTMRAVRESVTHLFSLARYEDVRVHADAGGAGVTLVYELVPLHPVTSIAIHRYRTCRASTKAAAASCSTERFGPAPRAGRAAGDGGR